VPAISPQLWHPASVVQSTSSSESVLASLPDGSLSTRILLFFDLSLDRDDIVGVLGDLAFFGGVFFGGVFFGGVFFGGVFFGALLGVVARVRDLLGRVGATNADSEASLCCSRKYSRATPFSAPRLQRSSSGLRTGPAPTTTSTMGIVAYVESCLRTNAYKISAPLGFGVYRSRMTAPPSVKHPWHTKVPSGSRIAKKMRK
jgi:hypothetical protein